MPHQTRDHHALQDRGRLDREEGRLAMVHGCCLAVDIAVPRLVQPASTLFSLTALHCIAQSQKLASARFHRVHSMHLLQHVYLLQAL